MAEGTAEGSGIVAAPGGPAAEGPGRAQGPAKVVTIREFCTRQRGSACSRCETACPKRAITFADDGMPLIDAGRCSACGICFGICDAFSSARITMRDLHARIARIALRGETVYLTCKDNVFSGFVPAANVVVLPCLACLSPEFLTLVLAEDIEVRIAADFSYCNDCTRAGEIAGLLYMHTFETAQAWSGREIRFVSEIPEKEQLLRDLADPTGVDRRSAFANMVGDVGDIASGKRRLRNSEVLQQFYEQRERARAATRLNVSETPVLNGFAPLGHTRQTMAPKRQFLLEALDRIPEAAGRIPVVLSDTAHGRCTGLLACSAACPTGARLPDPETGRLLFDARLCIGCGICVDACPEGAVSLRETAAGELLRAAGPQQD